MKKKTNCKFPYWNNYITGILSLSFCFAVYANDEYISEDLFFSDVPLISEASRFTQKQTDTTVSTSVIDREIIEASGAINIVDLLRFVPGFQVAHLNGTQSVAASHGLADDNPSRLEVRVNGFSVNDQFTNGTQWQALGIEIEDIERIEITRGSNASNFGFNSFLASINIITKSPLKESGTTLRSINGSIDKQGYLLRHVNNIGPVFFRGGIDYREDSGFDLINDNTDIHQASLRAYYAPSMYDELEYEFTYHSGLSSFSDFEEGIPGSIRRNKSLRSSLSWDHQYGNNEHIKLLASYDNLHNDADDIIVSSTPLLISRTGKVSADRFDLEISNLSRSGNLQWLFGTGLRHDLINGSTLLDNRSDISRTSYRFFGGIDWQFKPNWILNSSVLLFDSNKNPVSISPRIGLNYKLTPNHIFRTSLAYSENSPALLRQNQLILSVDNSLAFQVSDPTISNERLRDYELGYTGMYDNNRLKLDLRIFREELRDGLGETFINTDIGLSPIAFSITNVLNVNTYGFETEIKYNPDKKTLIHLNYNYSEVDGSYVSNRVFNTVEDVENRVPKHTFAALVSRKFSHGFYLSGSYYYLSNVQWIENNIPTPSYDRLDIRFGKKTSFNGNELDVEFILQNLLDDYIEHRIGNVFDTRAFLRINLDL